MRVDAYVIPCLTESGTKQVPGYCATCRKCGHEVTVEQSGSSQAEKKADKAFAMEQLQESCPREEYNRYLPSLLPPGITLWIQWIGSQKEAKAWMDGNDVVSACGVVPKSITINVQWSDPADKSDAANVRELLRSKGYQPFNAGKGPAWPPYAPEPRPVAVEE